MSNLERLQVKLRSLGYQGLLVPSSDEYLSEFAPADARRLEWATGFHGSTGIGLVLQDRAAVFLDSRYKAQGERDCAGLPIEVLDSEVGTLGRWLSQHLKSGDQLALDTRLQSQADVQRVLESAEHAGVGVLELEQNPIDELWGSVRPSASASVVFDYPTRYAGLTSAEKFRELRERMAAAHIDCELVCDPEDVAWLLNVRTNDSERVTSNGWHVVPIPLSRVLIESSGPVLWFVEQSRLSAALSERIEGEVTVMDPMQFEPLLTNRLRGKVVGTNLSKTPYRYAQIAARVGTLKNDTSVTHRRWRKHPNEIARAREGHFLDGQAVIRFLAWVQRTVPQRSVTELEAAQKLTEFRSESPEYRGISMPLMSASGKSGALPHYVPSERSNRRLNDHPIYWMDSGAHYYGCSTDNTVCITVGDPEPRHIRAHTLVVQGFIALAQARFPAGTPSSQIDTLARHPLWQEGMDYGHGTGHGVGNFMNIHEGPLITKRADHPWVVPLEAGMIVSNEPAYYADGDFGIRVESHLVTVESQYPGFLEFQTLSRLPIDPRLIDATLLSAADRRWLVDYHAAIAAAYQGCFDPDTTRWLQSLVDAYACMDH